MFHLPKYFILAFVGLAILAAFVIHRWQMDQQGFSQDMASRVGVRQQVEDVKEIVEAAGSAVEIRSLPHSFESNCMCLQGTNFEDVTMDEEVSCSKERQYLKPLIDAQPVLYREKRVRSSSEFPKECLIYVMKKWQTDSDLKSSPFFNRCSQQGGKSHFESSNPKPCLSRTYINVVYNYFSDVTDCLGLSQRGLIPKFYRESGFHLNAQNGGFGQLTSIAIQHVNSEFATYQSTVASSSKASCERLKPFVEKLTPLHAPARDLCTRVDALQNPLLNMFYTGVVELQNRALIQTLLNRSKNGRPDVYTRMEKLGLSKESFDSERLEEILSILAYNAGAGSAVVLLSNYLESFARVAKRKLKTFDFSIQGSSDKVPSFFDYVRKNQISGSRAYFDAVYEKARELDSQFKEGTCVAESFLSL